MEEVGQSVANCPHNLSGDSNRLQHCLHSSPWFRGQRAPHWGSCAPRICRTCPCNRHTESIMESTSRYSGSFLKLIYLRGDLQSTCQCSFPLPLSQSLFSCFMKKRLFHPSNISLWQPPECQTKGPLAILKLGKPPLFKACRHVSFLSQAHF